MSMSQEYATTRGACPNTSGHLWTSKHRFSPLSKAHRYELEYLASKLLCFLYGGSHARSNAKDGIYR
ncbi:MAG: hypothetical protein ACKVHM_03765, partial [Pseudomonadales bacterium]